MHTSRHLLAFCLLMAWLQPGVAQLTSTDEQRAIANPSARTGMGTSSNSTTLLNNTDGGDDRGRVRNGWNDSEVEAARARIGTSAPRMEDSRTSAGPARNGGLDRRLPMTPRSSEFSRYASKLSGRTLHVFGSDFFGRAELQNGLSGPSGPAVPADYLVNSGDEVLVQISGSYEAEIKQQVRRGGDITLPKVGAVRIAGVRAGDLANVIRMRLESQFRAIQVSVSFVSLHGMRVYVTGFVEVPGAHVVDSISTITGAISAAGGPSESGSYRVAELWRQGKRIASFDLYRFLVNGDSSQDVVLTAEDVIRVAPASRFQVALSGSVNRPAVYELLPQEGLSQLLEYAGGYTPVADRQRLGVVEIDANNQRRLVEISGATGAAVPLREGSVMHVFSGASLAQGVNSTSKIIRVEGEVNRPGSYVLPATTTIADAVAAAGGYTREAFERGLTLIRPSLAQEQELLLSRSLDELERSLFEATANNAQFTATAASGLTASAANLRAFIDRMRQFKPNGRLIVSRGTGNQDHPPVLLDGDKLLVPAIPTNVSVFGAVYGEGSYLALKPGTLANFLTASGGLRPGADASSIVVLKSDGSFQAVKTKLFHDGTDTLIEPGDAIFVPVDAQRGRGWIIAKDIGTMLYQFGLGAAALKVLN